MSGQGKPTVTIPESDPPSDLVLEDLETGSGAEAAAGTSVDVHYVASRGRPAVSSIPRGTAASTSPSPSGQVM